MADIELVIKIPEGLKNTFELEQWTALSCMEMKDALMNGTPLPKGHGRLIDADKLEYTCNSDECGMLMVCNHCQYHVITEDEIDSAPTIIEADRKEQE